MQLRCSPAGSRKCRCAGAAGSLPERPSGGSAAGAACGAPLSSPCSLPWRWLEDLPAMVSKKEPFACRGGTACLACSNGTKLEGNTLQTEHWEEICGDLLSAAVCCVYPLCFQLPVVFKALTFFSSDLSPNSSKQILQFLHFLNCRCVENRSFHVDPSGILLLILVIC